jgi:hypothetical protein
MEFQARPPRTLVKRQVGKSDLRRKSRENVNSTVFPMERRAGDYSAPNHLWLTFWVFRSLKDCRAALEFEADA